MTYYVGSEDSVMESYTMLYKNDLKGTIDEARKDGPYIHVLKVAKREPYHSIMALDVKEERYYYLKLMATYTINI